MPYRVINIYYSDMCYNNHINRTRIQSIASMALMVFPDVVGWWWGGDGGQVGGGGGIINTGGEVAGHHHLSMLVVAVNA